jgi:ubiquitin carboxyl-terminal hydrolase L3
MTSLLHNLGLSPTLQFHDVYSIDDPDLLAFIPRPAHALLLVFPTSASHYKFCSEEDSSLRQYSGSGPSEPVIWYTQTIGNACGLYGLLHAVSNGAARRNIVPDSPLAKLIAQVEPLAPVERARAVEDSKDLENAHASAAAGGDSSAPEATADVDLHYVCFVKDAREGHLWEMDGTRKGPLDRGALGEDEDMLSERALDLGVRAFLKREEGAGGGELRFSLIALAEALD